MSAFRSLQKSFSFSKITQCALAVSLASTSFAAPAESVEPKGPAYRLRSARINFDIPPKQPKLLTAAEALTADKKNNPPFNVETVFNHYMDMAPVRHVYRMAQWEMINTSEDTAFTHYFYQLDDLLGGLFGNIKKMHADQLERFSRHAHTSYTRIFEGHDKVYDRILKIAKDAALRIGFSTKAVANIEFYFSAEPGQNAFTVSGNNDRLIVVVNNDLVNNMTETQLQAIIYHELGHIRSLHSVKGIMHDLMMMLTLGTLAPSAIQNSFMPQAGGSGLGLMKMQDIKCSLEGSCSHHSHATHLDTQMLYKDQLNQNNLIGALNQGIATLLSLPPKAKSVLVTGYIERLIDVLKAEKGSPQTIYFFQQILSSNVFAQPFEINPSQLAKHLNVALMAVSRAQERSCDNYATSNAKNEDVAAAIAKLIAYIPQNKDLKSTRKAIEMIKRQVEVFFEKVNSSPNKDISAEVGTTHPSPALRVVDILNSEIYPEVVYYDKFLKLLFVEDLLALGAIENKNLAVPAELIRSDILRLMNRNLSGLKNINFDKFIQYAAFNKAILVSTKNKLKASEKPAEFEAEIQALEYDIKNPSALIRELETLLAAEFEKTKSPNAMIRLEVLRALIAADTVEQLNILQVAPRGKVPTKLEAARNRTILPLAKDQAPTNPIRASLCEKFLTDAKVK